MYDPTNIFDERRCTLVTATAVGTSRWFILQEVDDAGRARVKGWDFHFDPTSAPSICTMLTTSLQTFNALPRLTSQQLCALVSSTDMLLALFTLNEERANVLLDSEDENAALRWPALQALYAAYERLQDFKLNLAVAELLRDSRWKPIHNHKLWTAMRHHAA